MAQQQTPDELKFYIQKMIDAQEPEEAIAAVIQAYARGELKLPPPTLTTARPDQIGKVSQDELNRGQWGNIVHSLRLGGEVDQTTREALKGYATGAVRDLPATMYGLGKHVVSGVGERVAQPFRDLSTLPSRINAASNPELIGMGLKSIAEQSGLPSLYRLGRDTAGELSDLGTNIWKTGEASGAHPYEWGRLMGQLTGQPIVTEGLVKGANAIPVRPIYKAATTPIRAVGPSVENAGQWIQYGSERLPPYSVKRIHRWGGKMIGGGLEKIGELMKEAGLTQEEVNAAALKDFWGDDSHGNIPRGSGPSGGGPSGPSGSGDVWGDALKKERDKRFNFDNVPENPLTTEFNKPLPGGLHPPDYEPSLPFPKESEPAPGDLPIEGEQSGLNPEIKKITDKIKSVKINDPNPRKDALLREQGFEPVGEPDATGRQRYDRVKSVDEKPITSKETAEEPLPQVIPVAGRTAAEIKEIKATGLYDYGQDAEGLGQFTLKKSTSAETKGQVGGKEPPTTSNDEPGLFKKFIGDESGSFDPIEFKKNLQKWARSGFKADELFKGSEGKGLGKDSFESQWKQAVKEAEAVGLDWQKYDNLDQLQWDTTRRAAQETIKTGKNPLTRFISDESGSFDWKETYTNLRKMLGRDPSAAELEAAEARATKPGETTGNVAQIPNIENGLEHTKSQIDRMFEPDPNDPLNNQPPIDRATLQAFKDANPWLSGKGDIEPPSTKLSGEPIKSVGNVTPITPKFDDPSREWYQLPDGRLIPVDSTATKGVKSFDYQLKGGETVKATRIEQPEIEPHGLYGPEYKNQPITKSKTEPQSVKDYYKEQGIDTDKFGAKPEIPPQDKWDVPPSEPQNDVLGVRQRSTLRPANESDVPRPQPTGQQNLPLGPHLPSPQLDEYGIPQKRDWSQEDIFRINDEMKRANKPPSPPPSYPPEPYQATIPEFGDEMIQQYLGQEDARPPEMNDINTFRPPHSPDKISFMQKLKDMLDQEYA